MQDRTESGRVDKGDAAAGPKAYYISPMRRGFLPVFTLGILVFLCAGSLLAKDPLDRYALSATAIAVFCIMSPFILVVYYTRLRISPAGVHVRQLGWSVSTAWDNVLAVRMDRNAEGLVLREPLKGRGPLALRIGRLIPGWYRPEQYELVGQGRWIPLDPFAWHFRHGDLLARFRLHAPALFPDSPKG